MTGKTILEHFRDNSTAHAGDVIIKHKPKPGGPFVDVTWEELGAQVLSFACGLTAMGMKPGDRVAIISFNRLEWIVADLGTMLAGGVVVPIYHTNTAEQCRYVLEDSAAAVAVVEDRAQLGKILSLEEKPHALSRIVLMDDDPPETTEIPVVSFSELTRGAGGAVDELRAEVEKRSKGVKREDLATIVYTSGTTGPPKGCMISHGNIATVLDSIHRLFRLEPRENLSLMVLPISHLYPRVSGYYYNISMNIPLAIAESIDTLVKNMVEVGPTYFTSVPRIFEKVYDRIRAEAEKGSALKRAIFRWAVQVGRERSRRINAHQPVPTRLALRFRIADRLLFGKIRDKLGGRLRFAVSAGAPLSAEVGEFIHSIGIQVLEFYALTETISGAMTTFDECRYGTVGKPMPGVEIKLAEDGEILIRGNNFMGYYNRPDLTREILRDGWCHTGDVGRWDEDGYLVITDRKKDLIITSGGKNISPQNIENMLKRIPLVSLPMVHGDNRKYLTALITLDREETEAFARNAGIDFSGFDELTRHPAVIARIQSGVDQVNARLARFETIKKFVILPRELSQEEGEITPTLKLKRRVVEEKYSHLLDALYE